MLKDELCLKMCLLQELHQHHHAVFISAEPDHTGVDSIPQSCDQYQTLCYMCGMRDFHGVFPHLPRQGLFEETQLQGSFIQC